MRARDDPGSLLSPWNSNREGSLPSRRASHTQGSRAFAVRIALAASVFLALWLALTPSAGANDFLAQFSGCDRPDGSSCRSANGIGVDPPFPVGTRFTLEIIPSALGGCDGGGDTASRVDWGDGTPPTTGVGRVEHTHTYERAGSFVITMSCGGYVHPFDPLSIGGGFVGITLVASAIAAASGAAGVGLSFGPRAPRPSPQPSGPGQVLGSKHMPRRGPLFLGQPSGSPLPPTYEPAPPPVESPDMGSSPIGGEGGQAITGSGAYHAPPPQRPPPTPPPGPDAKTQSGEDFLWNNPSCPDHPEVRTRARVEPKSQQWRWWCPDCAKFPWG